MKTFAKLLLLFALLAAALTPQTVTVSETLKDQEGNNLVGFLHISNPAFLYPYGATDTVTNCTNASPIQVDTSAAHGLATGNTVYIVGVTGNTACNGTFIITFVDADSLTLNGSTGNGAYGSGGTVQQLIPVGARTRRYPSTGTFTGTVTISLIPTSTAIAVPGGAAAGFTYLAAYFLNDGSSYTERWNPSPTGPTTQTVSGIRTPGTVNPTATVNQSQIAGDGALTRDVLTWDGTAWTEYGPPPRSLYTATASGTVANTVTETTLIGSGVGSLTLPANYYSGAGRTLYVYASGYYSNTGTPTLNIRLKHGATALAATGAVTTTTGATNWEWSFSGYVTCRTTGATGTVILQGEFLINTSATAVARYAMVNTATVTIDTAATQVLGLTAQWGTASASNTITATNFLAYDVQIP